MFALVDFLVKAISALLVIIMVVLMVLGASMTMVAGFALLTALINWPLMAGRKRRKDQRKEQQEDASCGTS